MNRCVWLYLLQKAWRDAKETLSILLVASGFALALTGACYLLDRLFGILFWIVLASIAFGIGVTQTIKGTYETIQEAKRECWDREYRR